MTKCCPQSDGYQLQCLLQVTFFPGKQRISKAVALFCRLVWLLPQFCFPSLPHPGLHAPCTAYPNSNITRHRAIVARKHMGPCACPFAPTQWPPFYCTADSVSQLLIHAHSLTPGSRFLSPFPRREGGEENSCRVELSPDTRLTRIPSKINIPLNIMIQWKSCLIPPPPVNFILARNITHFLGSYLFLLCITAAWHVVLIKTLSGITKDKWEEKVFIAGLVSCYGCILFSPL